MTVSFYSLLRPPCCGNFCPLRNDITVVEKSMVTISYKIDIPSDDLTHGMVSDDDITRLLKIPEFHFCHFQVMSPP